jgi:hypothetical protein
VVYSDIWSGTADEILQKMTHRGNKASKRRTDSSVITPSPCRILYFEKRHETRVQAERPYCKALLADKSQLEVEAGTTFSDFQYRIILTQIPYPGMVPSPRPATQPEKQDITAEQKQLGTGMQPWVCPECLQISVHLN